jgi:Fe-S-cluster containining protein
MENKANIGRNELCSCGSGKKYKNCCYLKTDTEATADKAFDPLKLNKSIAYIGALGKAREDFCSNQLKQLQDITEQITKSQVQEAIDNNKTISCRKGCSACCSQYLPASLQECEAIVYYLYKHEAKLSSFISNYAKWKEQIDKNKELLENIYKAFSEMWESGFSVESRKKVAELGSEYTKLNIPCPFLKNNSCIIYDARPFVCSSQVAVTPAEWCNPENPDSINQELILMLPENFNFVPFYHESFSEMNLNGLCMQYLVYNILEGGYLYLTSLNDNKEFRDAVMKDDAVKKILEEQLSYYEENDPNFIYEIEQPVKEDSIIEDKPAEDKS